MRVSRRRGLSEIMAAVVTIAVTVIAGAALYGFINGEATSNEQQIGQAAGATANFLAERFVIVDMSFTASTVSVWIYNNGAITLQLSQVSVYDSTKGNCVTNTQYCFDAAFTAAPGPSGCAVQSSIVSGFNLPEEGRVQEITLSLTSLPGSCGSISFGTGHTYDVSVLGFWGSVVSSSTEYL